MANKKCLIFTSCPDFEAEKMQKRLPNDAYVICADGGYHNCSDVGFECDLLVGDRDSVGGVEVACEEIRVSSIKDDTDLMLAVKLAIERGFDEICIADSLTGRFEQVAANIQSLFYIAERGIRCRIISAESEISFLRGGGKTTVEADECKYFSLLAYGGDAEGVSITDAKYPLVNATLTCDLPLGVSNEPIGEQVKITLDKGAVMLIKTV